MDMKQRPYFPNLDGLRFFAFLVVFISHSAIFIWSNAQNFIHGDLGVSFFFVLSGFLITYLLFFEQETKGVINLKDFYVRRILRIFPVYFMTILAALVIILLSLPAIPFGTHFDAMLLLWFTFFLSNFYIIGHNGTSAMLVVLWSISVEQQFYLLWPFLVSRVRRTIVPWFLFCIIIIGTLVRIVYFDNNNIIAYSTFSVMSDLAMGALLGYFSFWMPKSSESFIGWWTKSKTVLLYVFLMVMIYIKTYSHDIIPHTIWNFYVALLPVIFSVLFALIIFEQNYSNSSIFKVGRSKIFTYLGKISYGLYAYHLIALAIVVQFLSVFFVSSKIIATILTFTLTIILARFSYKYIEKRILRLKGKFQ